MLYLKQTAIKVRDHLFSEKTISTIQNNFLFQLVVLSTIKGFLYKSVTEEDFFIVPANIQRNAALRKKILVLDMDQTLVYTRRDESPTHSNYKSISYDNETMFIEQRPYLHQFLQAASKIFDLYVYTAGNKSYADAVLNQIDKKKVIKKRFYRDSCRKNQKGVFYKDLKHLKTLSKEKKDMILVDDNSYSVSHNYPFAISIKQFEGNQSDKELSGLFQKLLRFYQ